MILCKYIEECAYYLFPKKNVWNVYKKYY